MKWIISLFGRHNDGLLNDLRIETLDLLKASKLSRPTPEFIGLWWSKFGETFCLFGFQ